MARKNATSSGASAYVRFLNLVESLRRSQPELDPVEERLLNSLARAWGEGRQVSVMEAMEGASDASPATVHRRLKSLQGKGMLSLQSDAQDNRVKYIVPTQATTDYLDALDRCVARAR